MVDGKMMPATCVKCRCLRFFYSEVCGRCGFEKGEELESVFINVFGRTFILLCYFK